ncbi:glycoside hydrolase family 43 protein [Pedobacter aquatilis]|uniref:glycoside hydrolase family 43 protein n=1 Tax=Pedobacter aquatilis TaxID=351343 RepID=UPI0025B470A8|nr:glycoside hydrolase family 43 protein [Pedobacter aquatilis]MDN3587584.1 glycoside hydrolase family 43 protein [Pedobacter aquatilis]
MKNLIKIAVFHLLTGFGVFSVNAQQVITAKGNPIITDKYTADPAAYVYGDSVYLYAGHDVAPKTKNNYEMNEWLCYSSADMINWKAHKSPLNYKDFSWSKGDAWASQVIERDGKFFWFVATEHATIPGKSIGVAVADNPRGPFKDAIGKALVTNDMTTATKITWDDIDPSVIIDDDGQAYLFWGNTQCYYAKLKQNMVEFDGPIQLVNLPAFTEAPWVHKRKDWYYLSYATGFPEKIVYAMSKNIIGPWEYKGILNEIAGNSNTNHQSIIDFKGKSYFVYHNGAINNDGGSYRRSVCIDYLHYNNDGTIKRIVMTSEGVGEAK